MPLFPEAYLCAVPGRTFSELDEPLRYFARYLPDIRVRLRFHVTHLSAIPAADLPQPWWLAIRGFGPALDPL